MIGLFTTFQPTEHSRALNTTVIKCLDALGLQLKQVAEYVGLSERYVSDSLTNKRPLAFWRFFYRVPQFRRTFLDVIAEDEHCVVLDRELVSMVVRVEQRQPVKADLVIYEQERRRA